MLRFVTCLYVVSFALVIACGPGKNGGDDDGADAGISDLPDADGDTIADMHEGRDAGTDTDGDGTPDYLDDDSDGDGIPDYREAGDELTGTPPLDTDGDGTPDFQDTDADGNGIPDGTDGVEDLDGDGLGNFQDLDDDNDTLLDTFEIGGLSENPPDTDSDGLANYQDVDSDGDTILDTHERASDPDMDGLGAYIDLDSDEDCIPDSLEAGDADPNTFPTDTDGDTRPDYLDLDSDNDGLSDTDEDLNCNGVLDGGETSAKDEDSDNDGVSDLVESVAGTDPLNPTDNPQANGDFFFIIPYQQPTTPPDDTLEFRTSIQFADIYFSFDTTGSMSAELAAMANATTGVPAIIDQLQCATLGGVCVLDGDCAAGVCFGGTCIEDPLAGAGCIPDMYTGVGIWDDLNSFTNLLSLQANPATTAANIPGTGCCGAEAPLQAPACVADGANCTNNALCAGGGVGCPAFRSNAVRILIQITDADDQCSGGGCSTFTAAYTGGELISKDIKFIGLYGTGDEGGTGTALSIARDIGIASGTVDSLNNPFVYPAQDAAVVTQTVAAVLAIARGLPLNVPIGSEDLPGDDGDSLQFIDYLEVNTSGVGNCTNVTPTTDGDSDGFDDTFPTLTPGTPVCWDVHPVPMNTTVMATENPQLFVARLTVYGDGSPLDTRDVFFLIPPEIFEEPIN